MTTEEVQIVGRVARAGGRPVGYSGDRVRGRSVVTRGPKRVVGSRGYDSGTGK